MKKKEDKKKDIEALRQDLEKSKNLFVTGYEKLKVGQDFELRKTVRGGGRQVSRGEEQPGGDRFRRHGRRSRC